MARICMGYLVTTLGAEEVGRVKSVPDDYCVVTDTKGVDHKIDYKMIIVIDGKYHSEEDYIKNFGRNFKKVEI